MVRRRVAPSRTMWPRDRPRPILRDAASRLLRMRYEYVVMRAECVVLHHHAQPFRSPRNTRVEPPGPAILKRKTLVEQHHVVPLRALRLVHGEYIAKVELVIGLALLPRDRLDAALEAIVSHRDFCDLVTEIFVRR